MTDLPTTYRTKSPLVSVDWTLFPFDAQTVNFEIHAPFEGATPGIRVVNIKTGLPMKLHIFTPPFCTTFPHLTVDASLLTAPGSTYEQARRQTKYLDLSMFGAGLVQKEFRIWMDSLDDLLLKFVFENQRLVGKAGETIEAIKALQRRMFNPRVSAKTGRKYEDSMLARCKAFAFRSGRPNLQTATENMIPIYNESNERMAPTDLGFHDMVVVSLRYDGCYAKAGLGFGNQWVLLAVKSYGHVLDAPTEYESMTGTQIMTDDGANPCYLFPEIANPNDFPRDVAH